MGVVVDVVVWFVFFFFFPFSFSNRNKMVNSFPILQVKRVTVLWEGKKESPQGAGSGALLQQVELEVWVAEACAYSFLFHPSDHRNLGFHCLHGCTEFLPVRIRHRCDQCTSRGKSDTQSSFGAKSALCSYCLLYHMLLSEIICPRERHGAILASQVQCAENVALTPGLTTL